jgi:hypothetical protein
MWQAHLVPAEIRHHVDRQIDRRLPGDQRQREGGIDERLLEFGLRRVVSVEVNRVDVLRQQREPAVVHGQHRAPEWVLINVADLEVLVYTPGPSLLERHLTACGRSG